MNFLLVVETAYDQWWDFNLSDRIEGNRQSGGLNGDRRDGLPKLTHTVHGHALNPSEVIHGDIVALCFAGSSFKWPSQQGVVYLVSPHPH